MHLTSQTRLPFWGLFSDLQQKIPRSTLICFFQSETFSSRWVKNLVDAFIYVETLSFSTEAEVWNWIVEIGIPQFFLTSGIFLRIPRQNSTFQIVEIWIPQGKNIFVEKLKSLKFHILWKFARKLWKNARTTPLRPNSASDRVREKSSLAEISCTCMAHSLWAHSVENKIPQLTCAKTKTPEH